MPSGWTRRGARCMVEAAPLLDVRGLSIGYRDTLGHLALAVQEVSFVLKAGEALGIVGESGSGKSTVARALLGFYRGASECSAGEVRFNGQVLGAADAPALAALRGIELAFVPQNPLSSLTHHIRVGAQLVEILQTRAGLDSGAARQRAVELFAATRLPEPEQIFSRFPHQLSGGQRQRVVIACALACRPKLLVLDEPTTALDKTTETQVLELVQELQRELGVGLILVTHDLNVVASVCDRVLVMKDGRIVEQGATVATFAAPSSEYTRTLVESVLRLDQHLPAGLHASNLDPPPSGSAHAAASVSTAPALARAPAAAAPSTPAHGSARAAQPAPVLEVQALGHHYRRSAWFSRAAREARPALVDTSFSLQAGEIVGIIGESGSGKTTLGSIVAGLVMPSAGTLRFQGHALGAGDGRRTPEQRRGIQIIFQDPLSSLNPRQSALSAVARPIEVFFDAPRAKARQRAAALLAELGLGDEYVERYPRQLSGGQQQRVAIARAFAAEPQVIICDEITSALDASIQGQVLAALMQMQRQRGTAMIVISHDLAVIWRLAQRVLVLQDGEVRDQGDTATVFGQPTSAYTRSLLEASTRASQLLAVPVAPGQVRAT